MTYHVCVAPKYRKKICTDGKVWVKDARCDMYVGKKERGSFDTKQEAQDAITEPHEIVVFERKEATP